jgi:hypothetical protein
MRVSVTGFTTVMYSAHFVIGAHFVYMTARPGFVQPCLRAHSFIYVGVCITLLRTRCRKAMAARGSKTLSTASLSYFAKKVREDAAAKHDVILNLDHNAKLTVKPNRVQSDAAVTLVFYPSTFLSEKIDALHLTNVLLMNKHSHTPEPWVKRLHATFDRSKAMLHITFDFTSKKKSDQDIDKSKDSIKQFLELKNENKAFEIKVHCRNSEEVQVAIKYAFYVILLNMLHPDARTFQTVEYIVDGSKVKDVAQTCILSHADLKALDYKDLVVTLLSKRRLLLFHIVNDLVEQLLHLLAYSHEDVPQEAPPLEDARELALESLNTSFKHGLLDHFGSYGLVF